jgi:ABC-type amino acid transport substrate-binding protein
MPELGVRSRRAVLTGGAALLLAPGLSRQGVAAASRQILITETSPWASYDEKGQLSGLAVSIGQAVVSRCARPFTLAAQPTPRILAELVQGGDAAIVMNAARNPALHVMCPLLQVPVVVLQRADTSIDLNSLQDQMIGVMRGVDYGTLLDTHPRSRFVEFRTVAEVLRSLMGRRINLVMGSAVALHLAARNQGLSDLLGEQRIITQASVDLACGTQSRLEPVLLDLAAAAETVVKDDLPNQLADQSAGIRWRSGSQSPT